MPKTHSVSNPPASAKPTSNVDLLCDLANDTGRVDPFSIRPTGNNNNNHNHLL